MVKPLKNIRKQVMEDDTAEDIMDMNDMGEIQVTTQPTTIMSSADDPSKEALVTAIKVALADTFSFYLKTHYFHWNIEGSNFPQYHNLLDGIYNEVFNAVDPMSELIRKLGAYSPGSFTRFQELTNIPEASKAIPPAMDMLTELYNDNKIVLQSIETAYELAEMNHEHGISTFFADRQSAHQKHGWFLRATLTNR